MRQVKLIYETHVADFSHHASSGVNEANRGKFLGLVESGTTCNGVSTCFDHLLKLGITHLQLMPVQSVMDPSEHDWGYNPLDFNAINPNYGTPEDLKYAVKKLKDHGIGVILDTVFNHVPHNHPFPESWFLSDDLSGVGNTLDANNEEVNKYIKDSLTYWITEFGISGFRFDLMGCFPVYRVIEWAEHLRKINPDIIIYGESWVGYNDCPDYDLDDLAVTKNMHKLSEANVGCFNDHYRETVRNHFIYNNSQDLQGAEGLIHSEQSINYVSCHDGLCLADLIAEAGQWDAWKIAKKIINFQINSKGTIFLFSGDEFLRSKKVDGELYHNTWDKGHKFNNIDWNYKQKNIDVFNYYKDQINKNK
jgi:pullulanase